MDVLTDSDVGSQKDLSSWAKPVDNMLKQLQQSDARILVLLAYPAITRIFYCAALRKGVLLGGRYTWLRLGQSPPGWWKREAGVDTHDCTNNELRNATQGYLAADRDTLGIPDNVALPKAGETASQWRARYTAKSGAAGISGFGPAAYDAVWAWAHALHQLVEVDKLPTASLRHRC